MLFLVGLLGKFTWERWEGILPVRALRNWPSSIRPLPRQVVSTCQSIVLSRRITRQLERRTNQHELRSAIQFERANAHPPFHAIDERLQQDVSPSFRDQDALLKAPSRCVH